MLLFILFVSSKERELAMLYLFFIFIFRPLECKLVHLSLPFFLSFAENEWEKGGEVF